MLKDRTITYIFFTNKWALCLDTTVILGINFDKTRGNINILQNKKMGNLKSMDRPGMEPGIPQIYNSYIAR